MADQGRVQRLQGDALGAIDDRRGQILVAEIGDKGSDLPAQDIWFLPKLSLQQANNLHRACHVDGDCYRSAPRNDNQVRSDHDFAD
jgi:hypothetical protein